MSDIKNVVLIYVLILATGFGIGWFGHGAYIKTHTVGVVDTTTSHTVIETPAQSVNIDSLRARIAFVTRQMQRTAAANAHAVRFYETIIESLSNMSAAPSFATAHAETTFQRAVPAKHGVMQSVVDSLSIAYTFPPANSFDLRMRYAPTPSYIDTVRIDSVAYLPPSTLTALKYIGIGVAATLSAVGIMALVTGRTN